MLDDDIALLRRVLVDHNHAVNPLEPSRRVEGCPTCQARDAVRRIEARLRAERTVIDVEASADPGSLPRGPGG